MDDIPDVILTAQEQPDLKIVFETTVDSTLNKCYVRYDRTGKNVNEHERRQLSETSYLYFIECLNQARDILMTAKEVSDEDSNRD